MTKYKTTSQDWFNHIAQNLTSNALIQYVLKTDSKIDYQLLKKSLLLLIQTEPILGCLFVENGKMPEWKQTQINIDNICCQIETKNLENEIRSVLETGINPSKELSIKVCLLDDQKINAIVVKVSHSVCDGSGSKYLIKQLADIYSRLEKDSSFVPEKNIPVRDTQNFYDALKIKDKTSYFVPKKAKLASTWGFPIGQKSLKKQTFSYQQLNYKDNDFQELKQFAKKQEITLNTLFMAAYFDALKKYLKPSESTKEVQFMLDLRKYLPSNTTQNICNLSAILNANLPTQTTDFIELVKQTDFAIKKITDTDNFIHGTIAGDLAEDAGFGAIKDFVKAEWENIQKTGNCTPMISNLGILSLEIIRFGDAEIKEIGLISPAFFAPAFMIGIMTYNNILTINASYYSPGINNKQIKDLLKQIDNQLKEIMN
ncbi:MAG: condensation domain-containing protein [Bacteroidales bacterium]